MRARSLLLSTLFACSVPLGSPTTGLHMPLSVTTSATWQNFPMSSMTAPFTLELDAAPNGASLSALIGLSNRPASSNDEGAVVLQFASGGTLEAVDGAAFGAVESVPYASGTSYHFRVSVDVASRTYTAIVTPDGDVDHVLADRYAFATAHAGDTFLDDLGVQSSAGSVTIFNATVTIPLDTQLADGGSVVDAGQPADAGIAVDAGSPVDAGSGGAPPALVQQASAITATTSPLTLTFGNAVAAGDLVTVLVSSRDSAGAAAPIPLVSGLGATWLLAADSGSGSGLRTFIFAATAASSGSVTLTFASGAPKVSASAQEWTGLTAAVDVASSGANSGTSVSPGNVTPHQAEELVIAVGGHNLSEAPSASPAAPWSALASTSGVVPQLDAVYQLAAAPGAFVPSWTWPSSSANGAVIAAFESGASAPPPDAGSSAGQPPPPPLSNPQDPSAYGGDPTGATDSSAAVSAALAAGDLHLAAGELYWVNSTVDVPANRNIVCDSNTGGFKQVNFNTPLFRFTHDNIELYGCGFQGPNFDNPFPNAQQNSGDFIDVGYGGHNSNVTIIGNDFNGPDGWTGAIILYEAATNQPPVEGVDISYNTFEHCGYYAVQVTSATNFHIHHNVLNDCAGFVESDNTGQANTGGIVDHNHLTFTNGTGNSIRGGGVWYSELTCGSSCSGAACDFSGNYCHDNVVDGPYHSMVAITAVGGSQNQAYYCNDSCVGGCTFDGSDNQGPPCPATEP